MLFEGFLVSLHPEQTGQFINCLYATKKNKKKEQNIFFLQDWSILIMYFGGFDFLKTYFETEISYTSFKYLALFILVM